MNIEQIENHINSLTKIMINLESKEEKEIIYITINRYQNDLEILQKKEESEQCIMITDEEEKPIKNAVKNIDTGLQFIEILSKKRQMKDIVNNIDNGLELIKKIKFNNDILNTQNNIQVKVDNIHKGVEFINKLDNSIERWKKIEPDDFRNFEGYYISSFGNIKNTITNEIVDKVKRYEYVEGVFHDIKFDQPRLIRVDQLVLSHFKKNINDEYYIHHIDKDKWNNRLDNLMYCSLEEFARLNNYRIQRNGKDVNLF